MISNKNREEGLKGPYARPLLKRDIEIAQAHSLTAAAAARYLDVGYATYKRYATLYGIFTKNQAGRGTKKGKNIGPNSLKEILENKHPHYDHRRLRERLVTSGTFPNECALCGYNQQRPNGRVPLMLYCLDGNKYNLLKENLELRCFNCTYLTDGNVDANSIIIGPHVYEADIQERLGDDVNMEELQQEMERENESQ